MSGLVKAAKAEGALNVITLPNNWCNYGAIINSFSKKYGISINSENPEGSSQDEINAMVQLKGQSREPDVLDMGTPFAIKADQMHLLTPYTVSTWGNIPASAKATDDTWWADYGGYVAIGYNSAVVKTPPTSFKSLLNPIYKHMVGINNSPTEAGAAFAAVYAAALANGGSFGNIGPGIIVLPAAQQGGQLRPRDLRPLDGPERGYAHRHLVGLPAGVRDRARGPDLEGRHPERRRLRLVLRPGHIGQRPAPRGRQAVGGVPVLDGRPKPVAPGLLPPDRTAHPGQERDRQPDCLQGAPSGARWVQGVPDQRPGHCGREPGRQGLVHKGHQLSL